jgi:hypothetical protein
MTPAKTKQLLAHRQEQPKHAQSRDVCWLVSAVCCLAQVLVPSSKAQASLSVAVRVRPTLKSEQAASGSSSSKRDIIRVMDGKIVVVLDPDEAKDYLDQVQNRTKEKRYTFDVAYDTQVRCRDWPWASAAAGLGS